MQLVCGVKCQDNGYSLVGRKDSARGRMIVSMFSKGFTSISKQLIYLYT